MNNSNSFTERLNTKLIFFITCVVIMVCALTATGASVAKNIVLIKNTLNTTEGFIPVTTAKAEKDTTEKETSETETTEFLRETEGTSATESTTTLQTKETTATEKPTEKEETVQDTTKKETETATSPEKDTTKEITTEETSKQNDTTEKVYYVTNSGKKYHVASCSYLKKSKISLTYSEILEGGYTPCSRCIK